MPFSCPLCFTDKTHHFAYQKSYRRNFYECEECSLIFVDRGELLSSEEEKSRYDLHENHIRSKGYEKFLRRLIDPLKKYVILDDKGLDYGEGPYPMLREIFAEDGYKNINGYDPLYNPSESALMDHYKFIICCEVIEHTKNPRKELKRMESLLENDGYLAMSTGIYSKDHDFLGWQYTHDDTHINFFTDDTVLWIVDNLKLEIIERAKDFILFSKIQKAAQP